MTTQAKCPGRAQEAAKAAMVAALCVMMAAPEALFAAPYGNVNIPAPKKDAPLTADQKTLHTLNRLTFGPRPGDEQAVSKMGLEAWFEQQLHPETIDDSAFQTRMDQFPSLRLSQQELMRRFPTPEMMREMAKRDAPLPSDPVEHAIYADSMAAYKAQLAQAGFVAGAKPAKAGNGVDMSDMAAGGDMAMASAAKEMVDGDDSQMASAPAAKAATPANDSDAMNAAPAGAVAAKAKAKKKLDAPAMEQDDVEALIALPPDQRMARFVAMSPEEMAGLRKAVKPRQMGALIQGLTPEQKEEVAAMQGALRVVAGEALEERVLRDVYSQRQLQAVMDDFWLNHFNVYVRKGQNEPYYLASYNRDSVLPNAMGKFENLLVATAESPAMLLYLDNWQSVGPDSPAAQRAKRVGQVAPNSKIAQLMPKGINENYARELMELHTVGVSCEVTGNHPVSALDPACGSGYTQSDVTAVAKCFTGWTIDKPYQGGGGGFVFEANRHEGGPKTVLGHVIPEGGQNEGLEVLHILATSPATAHFVSKKLAERFVSDTPAAALVDRMAATFVKTDGDIKAVLTTMYDSPEFWAPSVYRAKVKTPIEFMASALRASDAMVGNPVALVQAMQQLGMPIYGMQTPNGYSWQASEWVSSNALVSRMNFALVLSGGRLPGARTDWPQLLGDSAESNVATAPTPATELQLEGLILGQPAGMRTRQTVLEQFNNPTAQQQAEQNFALGAAEPDADNDMGGAATLKRVKAGRGGGQGYQMDRPETPLDTMAGLLLGSPDFQRR